MLHIENFLVEFLSWQQAKFICINHLQWYRSPQLNISLAVMLIIKYNQFFSLQKCFIRARHVERHTEKYSGVKQLKGKGREKSFS